MISIEHLTFQYQNGKKNALEEINLTIEDGDFLGIIGESGAGKTTLTQTINGIIPHHHRGDYYGSVKIDGQDTFDKTPSELALAVGSVFQDIDSQMVSSVVEDELLYGLENFSISREEIEERVSSSLEAVGISHLRNRNIDTLSGGQKQKVAIAAIIALKPKILVLDEPTGELDPKSSLQIFQMLTELNQKYGITVIVVEQKIMLLCEFAKHLAVMRDGKLILHGTIRDVLEKNELLEQIGINCPRVVTLSNVLRTKGASVEKVCISVDEAEKMARGLICD